MRKFLYVVFKNYWISWPFRTFGALMIIDEQFKPFWTAIASTTIHAVLYTYRACFDFIRKLLSDFQHMKMILVSIFSTFSLLQFDCRQL